MTKLRIGTRTSPLATIQTQMVVDALQVPVQIVPIISKGDQIQDRSLASIGGKGLFISAFEQALLNDQIDMAVHSGKDMPSQIRDGFAVPAVLARANPADLLISKTKIQPGAIIGTSSPRRAQLYTRIDPTCQIKTIRGNVETRLRKLEEGDYDGLILAQAGLDRLHIDLSSYVVQALDILPATAQGIIAIETKAGFTLPKDIDDKKTHVLFDTERKLMALMHADCHDAASAYAQWIDDQTLQIQAFYQDSPILTRQTKLDQVDACMQEMAGILYG
ncbi:MAG: hydroxymethylbilane synthase [Absicoccus sp.]|uniref:Hydroxymethylbilane synthase n=1 Tax=Absicoccus intestinalis TaxID=2926319 RepID=A0ABU4WL21_9FIRM|nr:MULTISPECIES: hydroxymethylbilane synthase [unclassified Absicoccus]MDX8417262.1 hydroxymethylbilane synthase [Absicoccus sp. CLA-KB-P134]MDY3036315.1 hydroxymethylbilane synthase [Absicoccus sp.]